MVEGKNREIRRVLDHFGIRVKRLARVRIGSVSLGSLESGRNRPLTEAEIKGLLAQADKQED